jgi:quinolinate synthase
VFPVFHSHSPVRKGVCFSHPSAQLSSISRICKTGHSVNILFHPTWVSLFWLLTWGFIYKTLRRILTKSVHPPESQKWRTPKNIQTYKTVRTPEPAQNCLYKSQSAEDCAHMGLLPEISIYGATTPSFTMHILICISFAYAYSSTWYHV